MKKRTRIEMDEIPEPKGPDITIPNLKEKAKNEPLKQYPTIKPRLNMYGIKETKDAIKAICGIGNAVSASLADDGKITIGDYAKFIGPVISLPAAISGIAEVPTELQDLTEQEKDELITLVRDELEVGDRAEEVTVKILNIIYEIKAFVDFLK